MMMMLYAMTLLGLGAVTLLIDRRVARLERRYDRVARQASGLLREPVVKEGNSQRPDACQLAKRQYHLGQLVDRRDRLEAKYTLWQGRAERCRALLTRLRQWRGRKLPYLLGIADTLGVVFVLEQLQLIGPIDFANVVRVLSALVHIA